MKIMRCVTLLIALMLSFSFVALAQQQCHPYVLHWRNAISPTELREYLSHSKHIREWRQNVETIKELNGGQLPSWWDREIIKSQFFDGLKLSWGTQYREEMPDGK